MNSAPARGNTTYQNEFFFEGNKVPDTMRRAKRRVPALATWLSFLLLSFAFTPRADATVTFFIWQNGPNVDLEGFGTFNLASVQFLVTTGESPAISPSGGLVMGGPSGVASTDVYLPPSVVGPTNFGSGLTSGPSSGTGDRVGFWMNNGNARVFVPHGYTSGAALFDTSVWPGTTLAGMGLTAGTYTWSWTNAGVSDSAVLNVGIAVPEPGSLALTACAGICLLGLARWRLAGSSAKLQNEPNKSLKTNMAAFVSCREISHETS